MKIRDSIRLAFSGVLNNKFRSFLTLLGIIIGVGAVIIMVALGSGTREVVSGQFESLNSRQVYLSGNWNLPYQQRGQLLLEDRKFLEEATVGIDAAVPYYRMWTHVCYNNKENDNSVGGVFPGGIELTNLKLKYGRSITEEDIKNHNRVAVVGEDVLSKLTDVDDYSQIIGEKINIDGKTFIIIGILEHANSTIGFGNQSVFMPATVFQDVWRQRAQTVSFYLILYDKNAGEKDVIKQLHYLLDKKYGKANGKSRFITEGIKSRTDIYKKVITVFTYVLGGIAAISLLVGGIGVMNIMLVTVKERTKEIGVRMSIGASSKDIQNQFLFESIILTVGGGILGIICGSGLSLVMNIIIKSKFDWWQGTIPVWVILLSFGVTVLIGLIFGFYPAYKASKLDPIEALRFE